MNVAASASLFANSFILAHLASGTGENEGRAKSEKWELRAGTSEDRPSA